VNLVPLKSEAQFENFYQVRPVEWGVTVNGDGASLGMKCVITASWDAKEKKWADWTTITAEDGSPFGYTLASYTVMFVKDGGGMNSTGIAQINNAMPGLLNDLTVTEEPPPDTFKFVVDAKMDTWEGKATLRVKWLYPFEHIPGTGILNALKGDKLKAWSEAKAAELRAATAK